MSQYTDTRYRYLYKKNRYLYEAISKNRYRHRYGGYGGLIGIYMDQSPSIGINLASHQIIGICMSVVRKMYKKTYPLQLYLTIFLKNLSIVNSNCNKEHKLKGLEKM